MCKCANVQMLKCANTQMRKYLSPKYLFPKAFNSYLLFCTDFATDIVAAVTHSGLEIRKTLYCWPFGRKREMYVQCNCQANANASANANVKCQMPNAKFKRLTPTPTSWWMQVILHGTRKLSDYAKLVSSATSDNPLLIVASQKPSEFCKSNLQSDGALSDAF